MKTVVYSFESINAMIENIMYNDGPDRHTDGSTVITEYIMALLTNKHKQWEFNYFKNGEKQMLKDPNDPT